MRMIPRVATGLVVLPLVLLPALIVQAEDLTDCIAAQRAKGNGEADKAIALYSSCIEGGDLTARNHAIALNNRGNLFLDRSEYDRALADFNEALQLRPGYAKPLSNRGTVYQRLGQYRDAARDYIRAIEIDADHLNAYNNLAWLRATCPDQALRNGEEAVALALRVNEALDWQDSSSLDTLAAAYAEIGDFDSAIKYQQDAMALADKTQRLVQQIRLEMYKKGRPYREDFLEAGQP